MIVCLILLGALLAVGILLRLTHRPDAETPQETPETASDNSQCCGLHLVCEKGLPKSIDNTIVYFDDEELDAFAGREATSYTEAEADAFRDVLMTLRPEEIADWDHSLSLRGIVLPDAVRDEMIMLITDLRASL